MIFVDRLATTKFRPCKFHPKAWVPTPWDFASVKISRYTVRYYVQRTPHLGKIFSECTYDVWCLSSEHVHSDESLTATGEDKVLDQFHHGLLGVLLICIHPLTCNGLHVYVHVSVCVCVCMCVYMCVCVCVRVTCIYTQKYIVMVYDSFPIWLNLDSYMCMYVNWYYWYLKA